MGCSNGAQKAPFMKVIVVHYDFTLIDFIPRVYMHLVDGNQRMVENVHLSAQITIMEAKEICNHINEKNI